MHQHRRSFPSSGVSPARPQPARVTDSSFHRRNIKQWLGYPVKRTIRDAQGQVILEIGDLVTPEALQRAWEAGSLPTLVDALYRG